MADYSQQLRAVEWKTPITLEDFANPGQVKVNPALASGDAIISKDGGATAPLNTLPDVEPNSSAGVLVTASATEMTCEYGWILLHDQTVPPEWADVTIILRPVQ